MRTELRKLEPTNEAILYTAYRVYRTGRVRSNWGARVFFDAARVTEEDGGSLPSSALRGKNESEMALF